MDGLLKVKILTSVADIPTLSRKLYLLWWYDGTYCSYRQLRYLPRSTLMST